MRKPDSSAMNPTSHQSETDNMDHIGHMPNAHLINWATEMYRIAPRGLGWATKRATGLQSSPSHPMLPDGPGDAVHRTRPSLLTDFNKDAQPCPKPSTIHWPAVLPYVVPEHLAIRVLPER